MERQAKDGTIYKQVGKDEWTPVIRMAKDGVAYKKVGADEWTPLDASEQPPQEDGIGAQLLDGVSKVGKAIDSYSGAASTRAAIGAMQDGKNPISAFTAQYGEDPSKAPTGKDIAARAGLSRDEKIPLMKLSTLKDIALFRNPNILDTENPDIYHHVSPAGVAGVGVDLVADPLNAVPLIGAAGKGLSKAAPAVGRAMRGASEASQVQRASAAAEGAGKASAMIKGGASEVEQSGKLFSYKAPESLDELRAWKPEAGTGEVVGKARLQEIEQRLPDLRTKPLKYHHEMMENPKSMKELKLKFENLPTADAKKIATYNQEMVNESTRKIREVAEQMAGGEPRTLTDAGNDFIGAVKQKYQAEKDTLGPAFQEIQKRSQAMNQVAGRDLVQSLGENSKIGSLIKQDVKTGRLGLSKNTPRTGLSDSEHSMLSRVVDDLNDGMTFKEIQETREFLRKAVDPTNPGASAEINKVRSILLGQLESMSSKLGPDVGKTFKGYAVNERSREAVEQIIGGGIDSLDAMYAANPDKVVGKIFSNPNHAKIVSAYVGPEKMREMSAAFVQQGIDKATDSAKGFSPEKFRSWLKTNKNFVNSNLDKETSQRLHDLADYGYFGKRFLDEVNPSGTAASLKAMLEPGSFVQRVKNEGIFAATASEATSRANAALKQRSAVKSVNEMLGAPRSPGLAERLPSLDAKKLQRQATSAQFVNAGARFAERTGAAMSAKGDERGPSLPTRKGKEKWADDGIRKLFKHDESLKQLDGAMLDDTKAQQLFIAASSLTPGSPAMNKIVQQLKKQFGGE